MAKWMKWLAGVVLCFTLVVGMIPKHVWAQETTGESSEIATVTRTVSFRSGPSTSDERYRYLQKGEVVLVLEHTNAYWLKIQDSKGQIGYVSALSKYVTLSTVSYRGEPNGKVVRGVSFRTGPSTSYERMRYLKKGELIWILEEVNTYWYKVMDLSGTVGYASSLSKYIEPIGEIPAQDEEPIEVTNDDVADEDTEEVTNEDPDLIPPEEPEEAHFQDQPNGVIVRGVSFRTGPSTSYERMRYLKKGEEVIVLDKVNAYWYKVEDQSGVVGYVSTSSKYIMTDYVEPYKSLDYADAAELVIEAGMQYLGTPYEFGSRRYDTTTFDCSDFVRQAFIDGIGQRLPGDSRSQADHVQTIGNTHDDWRDLQPGELLFFMSYYGNKASDYADIDKSEERVTHVALYLGEGKILHTYSTKSGGVRIDEIEGTSWELRFLFGGSTY